MFVRLHLILHIQYIHYPLCSFVTLRSLCVLMFIVHDHYVQLAKIAFNPFFIGKRARACKGCIVRNAVSFYCPPLVLKQEAALTLNLLLLFSPPPHESLNREGKVIYLWN